MVKEMVVKESLSREMISAGEDLTRRLDDAKFNVCSSLWLYIPEGNAWRFIIASPKVRTDGPKRAYKKIQSVISKTFKDQPEILIPLKDVVVLDAKDHFISLLRGAIKTGDGISKIRITQGVINGIPIEDAYIYRNK